jgi:hypothetical protein
MEIKRMGNRGLSRSRLLLLLLLLLGDGCAGDALLHEAWCTAKEEN